MGLDKGQYISKNFYSSHAAVNMIFTTESDFSTSIVSESVFNMEILPLLQEEAIKFMAEKTNP